MRKYQSAIYAGDTLLVLIGKTKHKCCRLFNDSTIH